MSSVLLDRELTATLALKALGGFAGAVVYADRVARAPGLVQVGTEEVHTTRVVLLAFRDEMPGGNWMHSCTYALIDIESGGIVARVAADRPPAFGRLGETWIVVSDPERKADLIRPSRQDP